MERRDGAAQEDFRSSPDYCVAWQEFLMDLNVALSTDGGITKIIKDNSYADGHPHIIFLAILRFEERIKAECNLTLQRTKFEVYTVTGDLLGECFPRIRPSRGGGGWYLCPRLHVCWCPSGMRKLCGPQYKAEVG